MNVAAALKILQCAAERREDPPYSILLVCGFTPLHAATFLAAHLQQRLTDCKVSVRTGLFGDAVGTLEAAAAQPAGLEAVAITLEWQDLDPRLGFRSTGGWGPSVAADIQSVVRTTLRRMAIAIEGLTERVRVVCSLPTLPLSPLFHTPGWQMAETELELEQELLDFAGRCAHRRGFFLVNRQRLAEESPAAQRFDFKSDLLTGLPYTVAHADRLAGALARLLLPPAPKKGLITDLDDTLWHGVVGEIGSEHVSWDLSSHHQLHGLYQKLLAAFSEEGVLLGIASKNDPQVARRALERPDLLLPVDRVFPMEIHWNAKSGSVERILRTWNIGADSVVFVDDSPMELAEVAAAHPGIECVRFPAGDAAAGYGLLTRLRDLCGKPRLAQEDAIRTGSIRREAAFQKAAQDEALGEVFLQQAEATISVDFSLSPNDPRTLELVNKTNQFNLNGVRHTEADWNGRLARPGAVLMAVSYRDKFGPLGKIAVMEGRQERDTLYVGTWVMSCRAFSRRIEHHCLKLLLERCGAEKIVFDFIPTPKNGPLREFLAGITGGSPEGCVAITRRQFAETCPGLYHHVEERQPGQPAWTGSQRG